MRRLLQRRILDYHRSWRNARPNYGPLLPHCRKSLQLVTFTVKNDGYHIVCGMAADLTIDIVDDSGENPEDQHVVRQLKAGERVLTKVRREKNNLQDANTKLSVELKDVRPSLRTPRRRISGFNVAFLVSAWMNP